MVEGIPPNDDHRTPPPGHGATPTAPPVGVPDPRLSVAAHPPQQVLIAPERRSSTLRRLMTTFVALLFLSSIVMNVYLLVLVAARFDQGLQQQVLRKGEDDQRVAVYSISGLMNDEAVGTFAAFYRQIADEDNIKAVVLRVESPGGGVTPSDQIHRMVKSLRDDYGKPVVVSMGGLAASGGYYIAAPANEIYAEPTTVTGSIGVIAAWVVVKGTLEKIGAEFVVMKSDDARGWKDAMSFLKRPDERQREHLQHILNEVQDRFEHVVRQGRGDRLNVRPVEPYTITVPDQTAGATRTVRIQGEVEPFNGKSYLADEALGLGLIDAIGYREDAIDAAARLAGLSSPKVVQYAPRPGLMEQLFQSRATPAPLISRDLLDEVQTPRILLMWKVE